MKTHSSAERSITQFIKIKLKLEGETQNLKMTFKLEVWESGLSRLQLIKNKERFSSNRISQAKILVAILMEI